MEQRSLDFHAVFGWLCLVLLVKVRTISIMTSSAPCGFGRRARGMHDAFRREDLECDGLGEAFLLSSCCRGGSVPGFSRVLVGGRALHPLFATPFL